MKLILTLLLTLVNCSTTTETLVYKCPTTDIVGPHKMRWLDRVELDHKMLKAGRHGCSLRKDDQVCLIEMHLRDHYHYHFICGYKRGVME